MAEDYYEDAGADEMAAPSSAPESDAVSGETAVLPVSFFSGKELTPGSECKIRVEKVHDDSVEVSYVAEHGEEEEPELAAEEAALPPDMASMEEMMG